MPRWAEAEGHPSSAAAMLQEPAQQSDSTPQAVLEEPPDGSHQQRDSQAPGWRSWLEHDFSLAWPMLE